MTALSSWALLLLAWLNPFPQGLGVPPERIELAESQKNGTDLLLKEVSDLQDRIVRVRTLVNIRFDSAAAGKMTFEYSYGSGVFISEDGLIATAQHVVRRRNAVPPTRRETAVLLHGAHTYIPVDLVAEDPRADVAFLRINPRALPFRKCFPLTKPPEPSSGSRSYVLGLRASAPPDTFEVGLIEGLFVDASQRIADLYKGDLAGRGPWVAISQQLLPGYSGGAILDTSGTLTGLVVGVPEVQGVWRGDFSFGVSAEVIGRLISHHTTIHRIKLCETQ